MSLSARDKKIVIGLAPLLVVLAYWFLLFSPKREEAASAGTELAKQEQRRDAAQQRADRLSSAKADFASDYADLVGLGKAVPTSVDMPSLLVQLQSAAGGTGIAFTKISTGEREGAPAATAPEQAKNAGSGDGSQPAAAEGAPAESKPGATAEGATEGVNDANAANSEGAAAANGSADPAAGGTSAPGLESIPLTLEFSGNFFDLADFFHRLKRFVRVSGEEVAVKGRLLTVDGFKFSSDTSTFPKLKAEVNATVYLAPKAEGATAGATPAGPTPAAAPPASGAPAATPAPVAPTATSVPQP